MTRHDGYAPIRDYAAIGDGRTVALVASDGAIDWLCLPDLDSASVFAGLLDAERGGRFVLSPSVAYDATRRYLPNTNVLETTFVTAAGTVRVTDAMTLPQSGLTPYRELVRRVEGVAGEVAMRWAVEPRFAYGSKPRPFTCHGGIPVAAFGRDALAVLAWNVGPVEIGDGSVGGTFASRGGESGLLVLCAAHQEPLVLPPRNEIESRLDGTVVSWRTWAEGRSYIGLWRRRGDSQCARVKAACLCAIRRDRSSRDDVNSGGDRRPAQLGLPLLLAARCRLHVAGLARAWLWP
jgi:GH15 family glucan-1,4-alpha-glucosidase